MLSVAVALGLLLAALAPSTAMAAKGDLERISVAPAGSESDGDSTAASISHTGRAVAFESTATTLVGGDLDGASDVFVRRRASGSTERVGPGTDAMVSGDGGTVVWEAFAPELGGGAFEDIFLRRGGGAITRVTAPNGFGDDVGGSDATVSNDGTTVAFASANQELIADDENGLSDVFSWRGGSVQRVSEGSGGTEADGFSDQPALSADGRFVAYRSEATNLTSGPDDIQIQDIFVTALAGGTERVSLGLAGAQPNGDSEAPAISSNGNIVAFSSHASNLVAGDGNGVSDVFVHDRNANRTERISAGGSAHAFQPSISGDGRLVAFTSGDSTLTPGDTDNVADVFVHDRSTGTTARVSERHGSRFGAGDDATAPAISGDGCLVAFEVGAGSGLFPGDTNGQADVWVVDLGCSGGPPTPADPVVGPPADPVGPQRPTGDPVAPPRNAVAARVRGIVRVKPRGAKRFTRLRGVRELPAGSEIDTRRGVLRLTAGRATALVSRGRAVVNGTTLRLTGRRLQVRAVSGRFRTRAKGTTTSGRNAAWLTTVRRRGVTVRSGGKAVRLQRGDRYRVRSSQSRTTPQ